MRKKRVLDLARIGFAGTNDRVGGEEVVAVAIADDLFAAWERGLGFELGDFEARGAIDFAEFVNAVQCAIGCAGDEAGANAEAIDFGALFEKAAEDEFVEPVGGDDFDVAAAGGIEAGTGLFAEPCEVAAVEADAGQTVAGALHLACDGDGVGNAAAQGIVGIDEEDGAVGKDFDKFAERGELVGEALDPGVGHGAAGLYVIAGRGLDVGGGLDAADHCGAAGVKACKPLGAAEAEIDDGASIGGLDDASGLGGNEGLEVEEVKKGGLDELSLDEAGGDASDGFHRENDFALGHAEHFAAEAEAGEPVEKVAAEVLALEISEVVGAEMEGFKDIQEIIETGEEGVAAAEWIGAEKVVERGDRLGHAGAKVALSHRELVKVCVEAGGEERLLHCGMVPIQSIVGWKMSCKIEVQITANAGRNEIGGWHGGRLKIKVKAPAVEGKANEGLLRFLAEKLQVHRRDVGIERGETAKAKLIAVEGLEEGEVWGRLGVQKPNQG